MQSSALNRPHGKPSATVGGAKSESVFSSAVLGAQMSAIHSHAIGNFCF